MDLPPAPGRARIRVEPELAMNHGQPRRASLHRARLRAVGTRPPGARENPVENYVETQGRGGTRTTGTETPADRPPARHRQGGPWHARYPRRRPPPTPENSPSPEVPPADAHSNDPPPAPVTPPT